MTKEKLVDIHPFTQVDNKHSKRGLHMPQFKPKSCCICSNPATLEALLQGDGYQLVERYCEIHKPKLSDSLA